MLRAIDVLLVCTGNVCRSPIAEALLRDRLDRLGVVAVVHSAGTAATLGPADPHGVAVLAARGIDLSGHVSRQLTPEAVAGTDLLLAMAREHLREAVVSAPGAFARSYTLKELVRRARRVGPRAAAEPLDAWLARAHEGRSPRDLLGDDRDDDVADPLGGDQADFERTADEIDALLATVVDLAVPRSAP